MADASQSNVYVEVSARSQTAVMTKYNRDSFCTSLSHTKIIGVRIPEQFLIFSNEFQTVNPHSSFHEIALFVSSK